MVAALALCLVGWLDVVWAAVPVLTKVQPETLVAGSTGVSIAVEGTGIDAGTVVKWGATALSTVVLGGSGATASVPDALLESVTVGVVTLENGDGVSNGLGVPVEESLSKQFEPILYVAAGLLGAMAFIWGMGTRW